MAAGWNGWIDTDLGRDVCRLYVGELNDMMNDGWLQLTMKSGDMVSRPLSSAREILQSTQKKKK